MNGWAAKRAGGLSPQAGKNQSHMISKLGAGLDMDRIRKFFYLSVNYLAKKVLIYCLGFSVIVGGTFLFTKGFSFDAYSDRLVWAGLFLFMASGIIWLGVFTAGSQFGIPGSIKKPEEAKKYYEHQAEIHETIEKRYDAAIQIWIIGLGCIGIGALVQILASRML
jgi:hypothetical protein